MDILLRGTKISAPELKTFGLINEFYDESEFIDKTKAEAVNICSASMNVVQSTKSLIYQNKEHLENYLNAEFKFMMR